MRLRRVRGNTIPGRGFNHFKLLRCRFRVSGRLGRLAAAPTHARRACRSVPRPSGERRRELFATTVAALPVRDLGLQGSRAIPFPGANPTFSRRCDAKCGSAGFRASPLCLLVLPLRYAGDPNAAVPQTDDRLARPSRRAAPRPNACRSGRQRGLRRNWTHGLLDQGGDYRTETELLKPCQEIVKLLAFLEVGEPRRVSLRDVLRPLPLSASAAAPRGQARGHGVRPEQFGTKR